VTDDSHDAGDEGRRLLSTYLGIVADIDDPEGNGRVRVLIPTLFDQGTGWARPKGFGDMGEGLFLVPPVQSMVLVTFRDGSPDAPLYERTSFRLDDAGKPQLPAPLLAGDVPKEDRPQIAAFQWGDYHVHIDKRGKGRMRIQHTVSEDHLEHDGDTMAWQLKGTSLVRIAADGQIDISANIVTINGRPVANVDKPI